MLSLAGVRLHPALRVLIGAVLVVVGLTAHGRTALPLVAGVALLLWAVFDGAAIALRALAAARRRGR